MKKIVLGVLIGFFFSLSTSNMAYAAVKVGDSCPKAGKTSTTSAGKLICNKSNGKLKWAVAKLPKCSPSVMNALRALVQNHQGMRDYNVELGDYIYELQQGMINAQNIGRSDLAQQYRAQMQKAIQEQQKYGGEIAKSEASFRQAIKTCDATGVTMNFAYSE
jgi:hypothetical protein